jgi:rhodanese-related sulfurtransferase
VYRLIAPQDLASRLEAGEALILVDLRDPEAYREGHLPGALSVPSGISVERWIPQRVGTGLGAVLYDAGGEDHSAAHEASHLGHLWYQGLLVLKGGVEAWREAGLPLEEGEPADPLSVGRRAATSRPSEGIIPEVYYPRHDPTG